MPIHPTAVVDPSAQLGDVEIGPYAVVGPGVVLRDGVVLHAHAVVEGPTVVGERTVVHPHAVLGGPPQDMSHDGSPTFLEIGPDCVFREFATAHRGTSGGRGITTIGAGCWLMCSAHVGHDCQVGDRVTMANSVALGGHVSVGDGAVLGGLAAVHQHARIGRLAMVGGGAMCAQDVPPFALVKGDRARIHGVNLVGMRRAGMEPSSAFTKSWQLLFAKGLPLPQAVSEVSQRWAHLPEVADLLAFLKAPTKRGICRAHTQADRA